jgi:hypothetical protein
LYGGGWSISKFEMLLHGDVDLRSINKVEVLIVAGVVADASVVEYVSMSVGVLNWRHFSITVTQIGNASP